MPDAVIGLPAIPGFAAGNWRLERNVARAVNPLGNTTQSVERSGYRWRAALRCPPYDEDDAAVLEAWFDEVSRADRWLYLSPPQNQARGTWAPGERVSNGTFINSLTTGWTGAGAALSTNARRLKVKNSGAAIGTATQSAIATEADKPHVLLVDLYEGSTKNWRVRILNNGDSVEEHVSYYDRAGRVPIVFLPSSAAVKVELGCNTSVSGDDVKFGNISVARCLLVKDSLAVGTTLGVKGGPASIDSAIKAGQFITIRLWNGWQMVRLKEDFDTDASGEGTLRFEPALRAGVLGGGPVIVHNPFLRGVLAENVSESGLEAPKWKGFAIDAVEDVTEITHEVPHDTDLIWYWDAHSLSLAPTIGTGTPTFVNATAVPTYFDSSGTQRTAAANVPCFDFDPVVLALKGMQLQAEGRANIAWPSDDFAHANWTNNIFANWGVATVAANSALSPGGKVDADLISISTAPSARLFRAAVSPGQTYTATLWLKRVSGGAGCRFKVASGNAGILVNENFVNIDIADYSTSRYTRAVATFTIPASGVNQIEFGLAFPTGAGHSFLAWRANLQAGAFPASDIETVTGSVTRYADGHSLLLSLIDRYNAGEGTILAESICGAATHASEEYPVRMDDGTLAQAILLRRLPFVSESDALVYNGAAAQIDTTFPGVAVPGAIIRSVLGYRANDFVHSVNGAATQTDGSGSIPTLTTLRFGGNDHLRRVELYGSRKPNRQIQSRAA